MVNSPMIERAVMELKEEMGEEDEVIKDESVPTENIPDKPIMEEPTLEEEPKGLMSRREA